MGGGDGCFGSDECKRAAAPHDSKLIDYESLFTVPWQAQGLERTREFAEMGAQGQAFPSKGKRREKQTNVPKTGRIRPIHAARLSPLSRAATTIKTGG
jgi:hypothetical protein